MTLVRSVSIAIGLLGLGPGAAPAMAQHHDGHGEPGDSFGSQGSFGYGSSYRSHRGYRGGHGRGVTFGTYYAPGAYHLDGGYPYDFCGSGYSSRAVGNDCRRSHRRRCRTDREWDDYAGEEEPVRICRQ